MRKAGQPLLFIAIFCWAGIVGGVLYSHTATLPSLLLHLPGSSVLENGPYPLKDEAFWKMIHPFTILFTVLALAANWKNTERRKYMVYAIGIYVVALIATFTYFIPEIKAFISSNQNTSVPASEWLARGQRWLQLSWIRGAFMFLGFMLILLALTKTDLSQQSKY